MPQDFIKSKVQMTVNCDFERCGRKRL